MLLPNSDKSFISRDDYTRNDLQVNSLITENCIFTYYLIMKGYNLEFEISYCASYKAGVTSCLRH